MHFLSARRDRSRSGPGRRFTKITLLLALSVSAVALVAGPASASAANSGTIHLQNPGCNDQGTEITHFASKEDVNLIGSKLGPNANGSGVASYFVHVTSPNGTLLGHSLSANVTTQANGDLPCTDLWSKVIKETDATTGYDDTDNNGGEYKVDLSKTATYDPGTDPKEKNFKVSADVPTQSLLHVRKFYDANANGSK